MTAVLAVLAYVVAMGAVLVYLWLRQHRDRSWDEAQAHAAAMRALARADGGGPDGDS